MTNLEPIVLIPDNSDFTLDNIPFGIISCTRNAAHRPASAIGEYAIDLSVLANEGLFDGPLMKDCAVRIFSEPTLNAFMELGRPYWREVRSTIQRLLTEADSPLLSSAALILLSECTNHLPMLIGDYTDFYASKEHATNVGTMFRGKDNALLPNWVHIPVGYHGRASSVVVSGTPIRRPKGMVTDPETKLPVFSVSKKLDIELEVAFVVGVKNELGNPVPFDEAEEHIFGMVLMNDWSARDIQQYEYVPLGPFLGKNFGTTVSPWIVTLDALAPFKTAQPVQDPIPAVYLRTTNSSVSNDAYNVDLTVSMRPSSSKQSTLICSSNLKYMYWSFKQQLSHHTVNGCPMNAGDLCGSGTISGPTKDSYGSLLELTWNGTQKLLLDNGNGETVERKFLEDGDEVVIQGKCIANIDGRQVRVGFGTCSGVILPAL